MQDAVDAKIEQAQEGDLNVTEALSKPGGGLGGARARAIDVTRDELEKTLGRHVSKKALRAWSEKEWGPGMSLQC